MRLMWRDYDPKTHVWAKIELIEKLVGEDTETTTEAMRRLGIEGNDQVLSFLSECLTDNYHHVSAAAAHALVRMGDETVLSHFIGVLMSPNHNVSQMAVWLFWRLMTPHRWCVTCSAACGEGMAMSHRSR